MPQKGFGRCVDTVYNNPSPAELKALARLSSGLDFEAQTERIKFFDYIQALGFSESDSVYLRALPPKNFVEENFSDFPRLTYWKGDRLIPRRLKLRMKGDRLWWVTGKGEKLVGDALDYLSKLSADGMGLYAVVNPGGHTEAEIEGSRVLFWEDDKRTKAEQLERFDEYQERWGGGFAVETRSSIHCYFRHDEFHDPLNFSINQLRAIREFGSDDSIWDAPRLMRLPGFDHTSIVDGALVRTPVRIVRAWESDIAKWAWLDRALPAATDEDIDRATGSASKVAAEIPVGDDPCDPRNFIKLLPHYAERGNGWAAAAIPAAGVTSNDGFQVASSNGRYKVWSGTVSRWEALKAIAAYLNAKDSRITLQGILDWLRDSQDEPDLDAQPELSTVAAGVGFAKANERTEEQQERDRLIARRRFRFRQYISELRQDFELTEIEKRPIEWYEGWCPGFDPKASHTLLIQGWLGAGKTEAILKSLKSANRPILIISPRNGLLRGTAFRAEPLTGLPTYHYQDDAAIYRQMLETGQPGIYLMAPDSFKEYSTGKVDWSEWIVVMDEFSGIRKEILKKTKSITEFIRAIAECGNFIAADAFLSNADAQIIKRIRKGQRRIIAQIKQKSTKLVHWLETKTKKGCISLNHDGVALALIDQWIKEYQSTKLVDRKPYLIAADSLKDLKILQRYIESQGLSMQLICSETPEENRLFLPNPDTSIAEVGAAFVGISPTIQSGADLQTKFAKGLLLSRGVLAPTQMMQLMGRGRQCDEWFVSAPRRQNDASLSFKALDAETMNAAIAKMRQGLADAGFASEKATHGWGMWEEATAEIEKTFGSEYLQFLLEEFFESVDTVELATKVGDLNFGQVEKHLRQEINNEDARRTLGADEVRGLELFDKEQQPFLNQEIWDVKLALAIRQLPQLVAGIKALYLKDEEDDQGAVDLFRACSGSRIGKLKLWIEAEESSEEELADALAGMAALSTNAVSRHWRKHRAIKIFRDLKLASLAKLQSVDGAEAEAGESAFIADSPIIKALYERFNASEALQQLFPLVNSLQGFFSAIKSIMSAMGFKSAGSNHRVKVDRPVPNGKDRHGRQRWSDTASKYFVGWLLQECSGNALFQEIFELIVAELREQIANDRARWASHTQRADEPIEA